MMKSQINTADIDQRMRETRTGLAEDQRRGVTDLLNRLLADEFVLYTKTRNYHWNVTGSLFYSLHTLLEEQYKMLDESIDELAERTRAIGGTAMGTLQEYLACASLHEHPGEYPDAHTMLRNLVNDHEAIIKTLRECVDTTDQQFHDMGTSDFLTAKMEEHEKMAWMLRAFLEEQA